jgi:hypothetical protein
MLIINNRSFEEVLDKVDQGIREQELFIRRFATFGQKRHLKDLKESCGKVLASIDIIEAEYKRLEEDTS